MILKIQLKGYAFKIKGVPLVKYCSAVLVCGCWVAQGGTLTPPHPQLQTSIYKLIIKKISGCPERCATLKWGLVAAFAGDGECCSLVFSGASISGFSGWETGGRRRHCRRPPRPLRQPRYGCRGQSAREELRWAVGPGAGLRWGAAS